MQSLSPHMEPCPGALGTPRGEKLNSQWEAGLGDWKGTTCQAQRTAQQRPGGLPHFWLLFPPSPERPHLNLWLEAPDLLLAEIDLPKLVSVPSTTAGE